MATVNAACSACGTETAYDMHTRRTRSAVTACSKLARSRDGIERFVVRHHVGQVLRHGASGERLGAGNRSKNSQP